ncbi:hypothetical protein CBW18_14960 [Pedobacter sp. AJM]|nr:hypothetical protein CBW18_14960 [Pedobacter sp. AJM]
MIMLNRKIFFFALMLLTTVHWDKIKAQTLATAELSPPARPFSFPIQLEMRVPFAPTAFRSGSYNHLIYELYLTNFSSTPLKLHQIALIDPRASKAKPIITFDTAQLQPMVKPLGATDSDKLMLAGGQTAVIYIEAITDLRHPFPESLAHRVITTTDSLEGAIISTHQSHLQVLGPPLQGSSWTAVDGPGNHESNHHRRGNLILGGLAINSRRYAIDWKKFRNGVSFAGDSRDVHAYFCYGEPVFAVADGRIVNAKDGLPDNIPGHGAAFHPAVPLTFDGLAGNTIVIDLGNGQYAHYMHLQPKSLRIKTGDYVRKGQMLANIGASGDAREPHLHFEVTTSAHLLVGEGIPYLISRYQLSSAGKRPDQMHTNELPQDGEMIDFEQRKAAHDSSYK